MHEITNAVTSAVGDSTVKYIKTKTPAEAHKWVDTFVQEGRALSQQHPVGSSWIEKVDCSKHASKIVIR